MANPKTDDGYTQIANEILEVLASTRISGTGWMIMMHIIRQTYGYKKKEDWISLGQFSEATGLKRPHLCRALRALKQQNMITKNGTKQRPSYGIQKDTDEWQPLPKGVRAHYPVNGPTVTKSGKSATVTKNGNPLLPKGAHTKERFTKESKINNKLFTKPSMEELIEYCKEHNRNIDIIAFMGYYESNGWKVGKNPMKSWKGAVATWHSNNPKEKMYELPGEGINDYAKRQIKIFGV